MRRLFLTVLLVVVLSAPTWTHPTLAQDTFTAQVLHVADGDTLSVLPGTGSDPITIRLYGIDCPEKGQSWGARAKQYTEVKCMGKSERRCYFHKMDGCLRSGRRWYLNLG